MERIDEVNLAINEPGPSQPAQIYNSMFITTCLYSPFMLTNLRLELDIPLEDDDAAVSTVGSGEYVFPLSGAWNLPQILDPDVLPGLTEDMLAAGENINRLLLSELPGIESSPAASLGADAPQILLQAAVLPTLVLNTQPAVFVASLSSSVEIPLARDHPVLPMPLGKHLFTANRGPLTNVSLDDHLPSSLPKHDDFKVEYHSNLSQASHICHFHEYQRDKPAGLSQNELLTYLDRPWRPFSTRSDFEFAELALRTGMSAKDVDDMLSLIRRVAGGNPPDLTFHSHTDISAAWENASRSHSHVCIL